MKINDISKMEALLKSRKRLNNAILSFNRSNIEVTDLEVYIKGTGTTSYTNKVTLPFRDSTSNRNVIHYLHKLVLDEHEEVTRQIEAL